MPDRPICGAVAGPGGLMCTKRPGHQGAHFAWVDGPRRTETQDSDEKAGLP